MFLAELSYHSLPDKHLCSVQTAGESFLILTRGQSVTMARVATTARIRQYQLLVATATGEIPAIDPASNTWAA